MVNRGRIITLTFGLLVVGGLVAMLLSKRSLVEPTTLVQLTPLMRNAPYEVSLHTNPAAPQTGKETTMFLSVTKERKPTDPATDGRFLHAVVASPSLATVHHTFPVEEERAGVYRLKETFTEPGAHRVWVEIENPTNKSRHGEYPDLTAWADVEVRGNQVSSPSPSPLPYRIAMAPQTVQVGVPTVFRLQAVDPTGAAQPLSTISDPAFYAIVGPTGERTYFQHGHTENEPASPNGARETVTVTRKNIFPTPGRYMLWVLMFVEHDIEIIPIETQFPITVVP